MNKKNAKDYLPLVQALADGKEIEFYSNVTGTWTKTVNLEFDFSESPDRYRIKPALVITPGKWRMRNGGVTNVFFRTESKSHPWRNEAGCGLSWDNDGKVYDGGESHDLISKVETRWRPWKPEEVPLGREVRNKSDHSHRVIITHTCHPAAWFQYNELLQPDGTYVPCGVEEEI